jgi:YbbR domain-containing protein
MIDLLRQLVFKDFWLKLFSLALAVLIWVTISLAIQKEGSPVTITSTQPIQRTFYNLPVLVVSSAADVRDFRVKPSDVDVTVQGDAKSLQQLQEKDIRVMVDLTGVEGGPGLRKRLDVSIPPGVTRVQVRPEEVEVIFPAKAGDHGRPDDLKSRSQHGGSARSSAQPSPKSRLET